MLSLSSEQNNFEILTSQSLKCCPKIMVYFCSPFPFFLALSQWLRLFSLNIPHDLSDILCWWYYFQFCWENRSKQKKYSTKDLALYQLTYVTGVRILCLPSYYCGWTLLYGQGQSFHPYNRSYLLSSSEKSSFSFYDFFP